MSRPERRQTTSGKARQQKIARDDPGPGAGLRGIVNALVAGVDEPHRKQRIRRAGLAPAMTPQELMSAGYALLIATLADEEASPETKARLGLQILAEQRKVLEKWKLADADPARIRLEWMTPEACEEAEDDLGTSG